VLIARSAILYHLSRQIRILLLDVGVSHVMSHGGNEQNSICFICLNADQPHARTTRNSRKDYWICCDSCNKWFHAGCGGYTL